MKWYNNIHTILYIYVKNLLQFYFSIIFYIRGDRMSRNLDNTAKVFSLEEKENNNTFRFSAILKEKIDSKKLKVAIIKTLEKYPSYKVKIKSGFFWSYFENNDKEPLVEETIDNSVKSINLNKNNDYLFKVNYLNNKINLDVCHVLTDGLGAIILLKEILYNYLNQKHNLKNLNREVLKDNNITQDQYLKNFNRKRVYKNYPKKSFLIKEKWDLKVNKTHYYTLELDRLKTICKEHNATISEYLTALYIYTIYKTIYDKKSNKDISVTVPIDLRKHYNVQTFSNFFTCMSIEGSVIENKQISFKRILSQVHKEFKSKLTKDNIEKYLSRDVKLMI